MVQLANNEGGNLPVNSLSEKSSSEIQETFAMETGKFSTSIFCDKSRVVRLLSKPMPGRTGLKRELCRRWRPVRDESKDKSRNLSLPTVPECCRLISTMLPPAHMIPNHVHRLVLGFQELRRVLSWRLDFY